MKNIYFILIISIFFIACSSSILIDQWKNPENQDFLINKVLVVGMTPDFESRRIFEDKIVTKLEANGVIAVRSIDFFEKSFTNSKKSNEELNIIENQLLEVEFDAILLSKVISSEEKITLVKSHKKFEDSFNNFREDYYQNQELYYNQEYEEFLEETKIYHTETDLYCICAGKERKLLWKASIDIINPHKIESTVKDYTTIVIKELKNQTILIND